MPFRAADPAQQFRQREELLHTAEIAARLKMSPASLRALAYRAATGTVRGSVGRCQETLLLWGYLCRDADGRYQVTPSGHEIVRKARAMGW